MAKANRGLYYRVGAYSSSIRVLERGLGVGDGFREGWSGDG